MTAHSVRYVQKDPRLEYPPFTMILDRNERSGIWSETKFATSEIVDNNLPLNHRVYSASMALLGISLLAAGSVAQVLLRLDDAIEYVLPTPPVDYLIKNDRKHVKSTNQLRHSNTSPIFSILQSDFGIHMMKNFDIQAVISLSRINRDFNIIAKKNNWIEKTTNSYKEYYKYLTSNKHLTEAKICCYAGYLDFLRDGHWPDCFWVTFKVGLVSLPLFMFYKIKTHSDNIPQDAPFHFREHIDEEGTPYIVKVIDHPEAFKARKWTALSILYTPIEIFTTLMAPNPLSIDIKLNNNLTIKNNHFFYYFSPSYLKWRDAKLRKPRELKAAWKKIQNDI